MLSVHIYALVIEMSFRPLFPKVICALAGYKAAMLSGRLDQIPVHNFPMRNYARSNFRAARPSGSIIATNADKVPFPSFLLFLLS